MKHPKFIEAFFSAGVAANPEPEPKQKPFTHVIQDIIMVKGDIDFLKENLKDKSQFKKSRIVWLNKDTNLVIRYEGTVKSVCKRPIWEIAIKNIQEIKRDLSEGLEWKIVRILESEEILGKGEGMFPSGGFYDFGLDDISEGDSLENIFNLITRKSDIYGHYLVFRDWKKTYKKTLDFSYEPEMPLNEIHLHQIKDRNRLKIQNNYKIISKNFA